MSSNYYFNNFIKGGLLGPVTLGIAAIGKMMKQIQNSDLQTIKMHISLMFGFL